MVTVNSNNYKLKYIFTDKIIILALIIYIFVNLGPLNFSFPPPRPRIFSPRPCIYRSVSNEKHLKLQNYIFFSILFINHICSNTWYFYFQVPGHHNPNRMPYPGHIRQSAPGPNSIQAIQNRVNRPPSSATSTPQYYSQICPPNDPAMIAAAVAMQNNVSRAVCHAAPPPLVRVSTSMPQTGHLK